MKILNKIWGIGLLVLLLIIAGPHKSKAQDAYISEQDFYDGLEPYGTWIYDEQYGDVWVPDVDENFRPYGTQGHWILTAYGNTWVSDYPWGWATFHYGRWRYDDYYGWEWIPGYEWAPAWVSWRHGGGYYGWAPLMPGISIELSFGSGYSVPNNYWAFAPEAYINRPNIYNYYVPHTSVVNIINRTIIVNNTYVSGGRRYIAGPRAADIQRYTHRRPTVYAINNSDRPGTMSVQNKTVNMFRPAVQRRPDASPARVVDAMAYKQQNPTQSIAHRGPGGAAGFNHVNAAKLAVAARNANDNSNVVRVNRRPDNNGGNNDNQPRPNGQQPSNQGQPANQNPGNNPDRGRGRPENRPNIAPPNRQGNGGSIPQQQNNQQGGQVQQGQPPQQQQTPLQQQPQFQRGQVQQQQQDQQKDLQQKQQDIRTNQRIINQQRRQLYQQQDQQIRLGQGEQVQQQLDQVARGHALQQQQQSAINSQRRALREQQAQQQQQQAAQQQQQRQQQAQQQQQRQATQQAQQQQQRQAAQQAQQQQRAQQQAAQQAQRQQQQRRPPQPERHDQ